MSLATRCTACGTVFRVVQDQLKVSEGWVRCGLCNEVFSALEGLFDLDRDGPSDSHGRDIAGASGGSAPLTTPPPEEQRTRADADVDVDMEAAGREAAAERSGTVQMPLSTASPLATVPHSGESAAVAEADAPMPLANPAPVDAAAPSAPAEAVPIQETEVSAEEAADAAMPDFVAHANQRARRRRPWIRGVSVVAALALGVALVAQAAHHFRDSLAARFPETSSAFAAWCQSMACQVGPVRDIQDVLVESTALTRASTADTFVLAVALRNRSSRPVAMPSIELTLTDSAGQLVARRVLSPVDFRSPSASLAPGSEAALQSTLIAGSGNVSGYTVEIFNP